MSNTEDNRQPEYEENLFSNLPHGTLFQVPGDNHIWEKEGNNAVRNFVPSVETVEKRKKVISEREMRTRLGMPQIPNERMLPSSVEMKMEPARTVNVRHIPGEAEIRSRFTRLLQVPASHGLQKLPGALVLALEREDRLRAEKARTNDQSPMPKNPSELEVLRTMDYEQVPMGSFFIVTGKPHENSIVYLKLQKDACETVCRYSDWESGIRATTIERKPVRYPNIQRTIEAGEVAPVVVLSALTPEERDRLIEEHHNIIKKEKREVSQVQTIYDDQMRRETRAFWDQSA